MPRTHAAAVCVMAGMIIGFQLGLAGHFASQGEYYMLITTSTTAGLAAATITLCLLNLIANE